MIFDGMGKKRVPHVYPVSKAASTCPKLSISLFGIIEHTNVRPKTVWLYHDDHWTGGANLVCSILYLQIINYKSSGGNASTLYLQADNSWKESKNRVILCFLVWLVAKNYFQLIEISYLLQGKSMIF